MSLPVGILLDGDAVACGGKDVAATNGHQLATLVPAGHVVQHSGIIDESVQFADEAESGVILRLLARFMFCSAIYLIKV